MSKVGELGADILSVVRSRTASSCLRSAEERVKLIEYFSANPSHVTYPERADWICVFTPRFVFQPLHGYEKRLLLVQLAFQEGVPLDGLVQTALKVLKRHHRCPAREERLEGTVVQT